MQSTTMILSYFHITKLTFTIFVQLNQAVKSLTNNSVRPQSQNVKHATFYFINTHPEKYENSVTSGFSSRKKLAREILLKISVVAIS